MWGEAVEWATELVGKVTGLGPEHRCKVEEEQSCRNSGRKRLLESPPGGLREQLRPAGLRVQYYKYKPDCFSKDLYETLDLFFASQLVC